MLHARSSFYSLQPRHCKQPSMITTTTTTTTNRHFDFFIFDVPFPLSPGLIHLYMFIISPQARWTRHRLQTTTSL